MSHQPADAELLAEAIRDQLGEKVNAPGLRALKAVLALQSDASLLQADVTKTFKTSKDSIRKYRDLLGKLDSVASLNAEASLHLVATGEAGTAAAISARPLLTRDWLSLNMPRVQQLRAVSSPTISDGGFTFRELEVDFLDPDGRTETLTALARFQVEPEQEWAQAKRARQRGNWDAEVRAVRVLDARASAEHSRRERDRKASKREAEALVQHELGALQAAQEPPPGDLAWALPAADRHRFVGKSVWIHHDQSLQLAMVTSVWQNGDVDVRLWHAPLTLPSAATTSCPPALVPAPSSALVASPSNDPSSLARHVASMVWDRRLQSVPSCAGLLLQNVAASQLVPIGWIGARSTDVVISDGHIGLLRDPSSTRLSFTQRILQASGSKSDVEKIVLIREASPAGSDGQLLVSVFDPFCQVFESESMLLAAECFELLSPPCATWVMAMAIGMCALRAHQDAELEQRFLLTSDDLLSGRSYPCSCGMCCPVHGTLDTWGSGLVCMWCGVRALREGRGSSKCGERVCDLCPFNQATISVGDLRWSCNICGFDVCESCTRALAVPCSELGCRKHVHRGTERYPGPRPRCDSLFRRYPTTQAMSKRLELQEQHRRARLKLEGLRYSSNFNGPAHSLEVLADLLDGFGLQAVASAIRIKNASFMEQRMSETQEAKAAECGRKFNQCIIDACAPICIRKRRGARAGNCEGSVRPWSREVGS